jgi:hypothetical protein
MLITEDSVNGKNQLDLNARLPGLKAADTIAND